MGDPFELFRKDAKLKGDAVGCGVDGPKDNLFLCIDSRIGNKPTFHIGPEELGICLVFLNILNVLLNHLVCFVFLYQCGGEGHNTLLIDEDRLFNASGLNHMDIMPVFKRRLEYFMSGENRDGLIRIFDLNKIQGDIQDGPLYIAAINADIVACVDQFVKRDLNACQQGENGIFEDKG